MELADEQAVPLLGLHPGSGHVSTHNVSTDVQQCMIAQRWGEPSARQLMGE